VYKAEDTKLGRRAALKIPPPERVADPSRKRRFIQEACAVSALNHPSTVTIRGLRRSGLKASRWMCEA